jgi:hypothetical protein
MTLLRSKPADGAPRLLITLGSLAIVFHLGAVAIHALAAQSGPWPGPDGPSMAAPPAFAASLDEPLAQGYLKPLKLTHNYHFWGNRPSAPGVFLEVKLKDAKGGLLITLRFPDDTANAWVRYQQGLFVQGFVPDQPITPPQGETIPAPKQQVRTTTIWDLAGEQSLRLNRVPEHLIPRNRPVWGPTEWSLVLSRSLARYLCHKHGAATAEVVRHSRESISPAAFLTGNPPPMAFADLIANYGELSGE